MARRLFGVVGTTIRDAGGEVDDAFLLDLIRYAREKITPGTIVTEGPAAEQRKPPVH